MAKPQTKILEISTAAQGSQNIRVVTAASLFDGHDVAINIAGAEARGYEAYLYRKR